MSTFIISVLLSIASFAMIIHGRAIELNTTTTIGGTEGYGSKRDQQDNPDQAASRDSTPSLWKKYQSVWILLIVIAPAILYCVSGAIFVFTVSICMKQRARREPAKYHHLGGVNCHHHSGRDYRPEPLEFGDYPTHPSPCHIPDLPVSSGDSYGGGYGGDYGGGY